MNENIRMLRQWRNVKGVGQKEDMLCEKKSCNYKIKVENGLELLMTNTRSYR